MFHTHPYRSYLLVTVISWVLFYLAATSGLLATGYGLLAFGAFYMWIPGLVALVCAYRERVPLPLWKKPTMIWLYAVLTPVLLAIAVVALSIPFAYYSGGEYTGWSNITSVFQNYYGAKVDGFTSWQLYAMLIAAVVVTGTTINLMASLGEELYWRGYLWETTRREGFWRSSLTIGVLWGIWHFPLVYFYGYNYPFHPAMGLPLMVIFCVLMSPILSYFRYRSQGILVPAIFHGVVNASSGLWMVFFQEVDTLWVGLMGIPGFILLLCVNFFIYYLYTRSPRKSLC